VPPRLQATQRRCSGYADRKRCRCACVFIFDKPFVQVLPPSLVRKFRVLIRAKCMPSAARNYILISRSTINAPIWRVSLTLLSPGLPPSMDGRRRCRTSFAAEWQLTPCRHIPRCDPMAPLPEGRQMKSVPLSKSGVHLPRRQSSSKPRRATAPKYSVRHLRRLRREPRHRERTDLPPRMREQLSSIVPAGVGVGEPAD